MRGEGWREGGRKAGKARIPKIRKTTAIMQSLTISATAPTLRPLISAALPELSR